MVEMTALWLPILLSAVFVFVASSVVHMVLPYHRSDYGKLPNEDAVLDALRAQNAGAGDYVMPHCVGPEARNDPQMKAKLERGPIGVLTVRHGFAMGTSLVAWFVYCLVIGVFAAYLASRFLAPGVEYLQVFRLVGTTSFLAYAGAAPTNSIWLSRQWSTTVKHVFDGLLYALLTAGVFGWLWPA
jgi:hypothetical protein